eukprot:gene1630-4328_t
MGKRGTPAAPAPGTKKQLMLDAFCTRRPDAAAAMDLEVGGEHGMDSDTLGIFKGIVRGQMETEFQRKTRRRANQPTAAEATEIAEIVKRTTVATAQKEMKRRYGKTIPWSTVKGIAERYNPKTGEVRAAKRGRPPALTTQEQKDVKKAVDALRTTGGKVSGKTTQAAAIAVLQRKGKGKKLEWGQKFNKKNGMVQRKRTSGKRNRKAHVQRARAAAG